MRSVSFPFYKTKAWLDCRAAYLRKVNGLCELCLSHGILKPADIVHHKIHLDDRTARDPAVALNFDNLQALCIECHNSVHYGDGSGAKQKRYQYVDGKLVILDDAPLSCNV